MSVSAAISPTPSNQPPRVGWASVFLNWLVPGVGFILAGRRARGFTQMGIVLVTFAAGIALRGGVTWPTWTLDSGFNLVNIVTFIIQMGAGLPALVSLGCHLLGYTPLGGIPAATYFELGGYYLLVAGALNYFATCNLHDRLVNPTERYKKQESEPAAS